MKNIDQIVKNLKEIQNTKNFKFFKIQLHDKVLNEKGLYYTVEDLIQKNLEILPEIETIYSYFKKAGDTNKVHTTDDLNCYIAYEF